MKLTNKAKNFLLPCNGERIRLIGIVEDQQRDIIRHNCYGDSHYEYYITLKDIQADIKGNIGFIKKYINIYYNHNTSSFSYMQKGDNIEFYVKINIENNNLYIERPTRIANIDKINQYLEDIKKQLEKNKNV